MDLIEKIETAIADLTSQAVDHPDKDKAAVLTALAACLEVAYKCPACLPSAQR